MVLSSQPKNNTAEAPDAYTRQKPDPLAITLFGAIGSLSTALGQEFPAKPATLVVGLFTYPTRA